MKRLVLLVCLIFVALPAGANACVLLHVPEQSMAEKRHWSLEQTKRLKRESSKRLASGDVNVIQELAEILVPNIRPIRLEYSSCGPEGEIDFAGGVDEIHEGVSDDPRLKGFDLHSYRPLFRDFDGETMLGPSCNAEFRGHFAMWLRTNLTDDELRTTWLYLFPRTRQHGSYGSLYHRLISFDRHTRRPPMRWWHYDQWIAKDIERFSKDSVVGRRLGQVMSVFWAQQEPILGSDEAICPKAHATWRTDRERLINMIVAERDTRALLRRRSNTPTG
jgi:hypothetical protein